MEDYPRNLAEFEQRFATAEACRAYLVQLRWPDGFRCPKCGGAKASPVGCGATTRCSGQLSQGDTPNPDISIQRLSGELQA